MKKSDGASVLPGGFSVVDIHFEPWVRQHAFAQLGIENYPLTQKWLKKIAGMEEVKKAYEKITNGTHA